MASAGGPLPASCRERAANIAKWFPEVLLTLGAPDLESEFLPHKAHIQDDRLGRTLEVRLQRCPEPRPCTGSVLDQLSQHAAELEGFSAFLERQVAGQHQELHVQPGCLSACAGAAAPWPQCTPSCSCPEPPFRTAPAGLLPSAAATAVAAAASRAAAGVAAAGPAGAGPEASQCGACSAGALARLEALESEVMAMVETLESATAQVAALSTALAAGAPTQMSASEASDLASMGEPMPERTGSKIRWSAPESEVLNLSPASLSPDTLTVSPSSFCQSPAAVAKACQRSIFPARRPQMGSSSTAVSSAAGSSAAPSFGRQVAKDLTPRRGQTRQVRQAHTRQAQSEGQSLCIGRSRTMPEKVDEWRSGHQVSIAISKVQSLDEEPMSPKGGVRTKSNVWTEPDEDAGQGRDHTPGAAKKAGEWRSHRQVSIAISKVQSLAEEPLSPKCLKAQFKVWGAPTVDNLETRELYSTAAIKERIEQKMMGMFGTKTEPCLPTAKIEPDPTQRRRPPLA